MYAGCISLVYCGTVHVSSARQSLWFRTTPTTTIRGKAKAKWKGKYIVFVY